MTDVLQRILSLVGNELLLLQAMLEHAADVVQPVGAGQVPPEAGRFQPLLAIGFALPQQGQARAHRLRRMLCLPDKAIHPMRGVGADGRRPAKQSLRRPLQQCLMMRGHVFTQAAVLAFVMTPLVFGHDLARVVQRDGMLGQMRLQPLALQGIGH
ncbi:hypothetical protein BFR63_01270 [Acinetobacter pittii]|nr:hypothetical protein BFR63_01270 [Acinetobacter pittii]